MLINGSLSSHLPMGVLNIKANYDSWMTAGDHGFPIELIGQNKEKLDILPCQGVNIRTKSK